MQEKQNTALVWFRNDLRVVDNQSLYDATTKHDKVIGFVLIPAEWLAERHARSARAQQVSRVCHTCNGRRRSHHERARAGA